MDILLAALRAAAEPTRLRLLHLLARGELTVSELTHILGQSQPRVSRHLKLMCEAGLLDRFPEGAWVFYRIATQGDGGSVARILLTLLPDQDPAFAVDLRRLESVREARAERAQAYFSANAAQWNQIRTLHADDAEVEKALVDMVVRHGADDLIDLGTGTGRILEIMAPHIRQGTGFDLSRDMLSVARANLDGAGLHHCMVRQGDITQLPLPAASADAVVIHQVLHYAAEPALVVAEAARLLRPDGLLLVADFAPHDQEILRDQHAHRRLGFSDGEVESWFAAAQLRPLPAVHLPGKPLTVVIWQATRAPAHILHPTSPTETGVPA